MTLYNRHGKERKLLSASSMLVLLLFVIYTGLGKGCPAGKGTYVVYYKKDEHGNRIEDKNKYLLESNNQNYMVLTSGKCDHIIKSHDLCDEAAIKLETQLKLNGQNRLDKVWRKQQRSTGDVGSKRVGDAPLGCHVKPTYYKSQTKNVDTLGFKDVHFTKHHEEPSKCGTNGYNCICEKNTCNTCPEGTFSVKGKKKCEPCPDRTPHKKKDISLVDAQKTVQDNYLKRPKGFNPELFLKIMTQKQFCSADISCDPGWGFKYILQTSGTCNMPISEEECKSSPGKDTIDFRNNTIIEKEFQMQQVGYIMTDDEHSAGKWGGTKKPFGCYRFTPTTRYYYNPFPFDTANQKCSKENMCICRATSQCMKCKAMEYSKGGKNVPCKICFKPAYVAEDDSQCYDPLLKADIAHLKETQNEIAPKTTYLWQKEQIRLEYDKIMFGRKRKDQENEAKSCKDELRKKDLESNRAATIFSAIELDTQSEKNDDTVCLGANRDLLLKEFCSFTSDLDNLFQIQNIHKKASSFWPNICCKDRRDTDVETCQDPTGKIKRYEIIPFALSQGGNYSRHSLYAEVQDTIEYNGYLHKGIKKLLNVLGNNKYKSTIEEKIDYYFKHYVKGCGPRILDVPGKNERKFCELFLAYPHAMKTFYRLIENYYIPVTYTNGNSKDKLKIIKSSSFLETVESSLRKRRSLVPHRLGKNPPGMENIMQAKSVQSKASETKASKLIASQIKESKLIASQIKESEAKISKRIDSSTKGDTCKHRESGSEWTEMDGKLQTQKNLWCTGYDLDLTGETDIKNLAIYYFNDELSEKWNPDKKMLELSEMIRWSVEDTKCPAAPLFTADDIAIQQLTTNTLNKGEKEMKVNKEWVAVINLNSKDENGYIQSEVPKCEDREYLIGAEIKVKGYVDEMGCCKDVRDYKQCIDEKTHKQCRKENLPPVEKKVVNNVNPHFSKRVRVTGTRYTIEDSNMGRRRRLLQQRHGNGTG